MSSRCWVSGFVSWYNDEHRHSGIKFLTPTQRYTGKDIEILAKRTLLYHEANARYPERWSDNIKNLEPVGPVCFNSEKGKAKSKEVEAA